MLLLTLTMPVSIVLALVVLSTQQPEDIGTSDLLAFILVSGTLLAVSSSGDPRALLRAWGLTFGTVTILLSLLLFVDPAGLSGALDLSLYYAGIRFRGLSQNPNQAALALTTALCCLAVLTTPRHARWTVPLMGAAAYLILATGSDSGRIALEVAAVALVALYVIRRMAGQWRLLTLTASLIALLAMSDSLRALWFDIIASPLQVQNQLVVRESIWRACLSQVGSSPFLGRGIDQVSPDRGGFECHNLYLDVGVVGGLPMFLALVALSVALFCRLWSRADVVGMAALLAFLVCQFGNSAMRFPFTWLWLSLIYWQSTTTPQPMPSAAVHSERIVG